MIVNILDELKRIKETYISLLLLYFWMEQGVLKLVSFWRWNDFVTNFYDAAFDNLSNQSTSVKEGVLETLSVSGQLVWAFARIAVSYTAKYC